MPRPARSVGPARRTPRSAALDGRRRRSSTWPAPASATIAGPTTTSARSCESRTVGTTLARRGDRRGERRPTRACSRARRIGYYGDRGDEQLDETSAPGDGLPRRRRAGSGRPPPRRRGRRRPRRPPAHGHRAGQRRRSAGARCCRCSSSASAALRLGPAVDELDHASTTRSRRSSTCSTSDVAGPVNLTAPQPVTNAEFARTLGEVLHRPTVVPVPAFGPKLLLGRRAGRGPAVRRPAGAAPSAARPTATRSPTRRSSRRCALVKP